MSDDRPLLPGEYAVLGLLGAEPRHGYDVSRHWQNSALAEVLPLEQSVLYGYLRTLERRGYLDWEEIRVGNRPPRRIFQLSEDGWSVLNAWMTAPVSRMREVRLDLLLKIYVLRLIDPSREPRLLRDQVEVCRRYLADADAHLATAEGFEHLVWDSKRTAAAGVLAWLQALLPRESKKTPRRKAAS